MLEFKFNNTNVDHHHQVANKLIAMFLWPLITGALFSHAQYLQTGCDSTRLIRCQQDVLRDLQTASANSASIQYPIGGPPYSPRQQSQQQAYVNHTTCRLVRSNLDCLLVTTPACYDQGIQTAQNTDVILRAKRFLEQNGCNEPDSTWQGTFCYRSPEIRSCEERYGFTSYSSSNLSACLAYQAFKFCVDSHLRLNCKVHEMDMANEYLIDRASDLVWRCPANQTNSNYASNPYQLSNQPGTILAPSVPHYNGHFGSYDQQRPMPTYMGSQGNSVSLFGGNREQAWERFRNPNDEVVRYGISRYPGSQSSGEIFDRLVAGNSFDMDSNSDCPVKAAPYARECEDTLMEQQRLARDSRDGNELQRRICCSLFQYRDCISRVVLDRCADSSPTAVEILMGVRRREMTLTCRAFNRDICSGSITLKALSMPIVVAFVILTSIMTMKQTTSPIHL